MADNGKVLTALAMGTLKLAAASSGVDLLDRDADKLLHVDTSVDENKKK